MAEIRRQERESSYVSGGMRVRSSAGPGFGFGPAITFSAALKNSKLFSSPIASDAIWGDLRFLHENSKSPSPQIQDARFNRSTFNDLWRCPTINHARQYGQDGTGRLTVRVEPQ